MTPEIQTVVRTAQAWLQSSWHVRVPFAWLEACVGWLQEEAGGAQRLSQQQINQQVLDQWLLTDLRDLDYPVLPEGLAQAQKTELSGTFCIQVDSLLDVSQPAYAQLQKWRGTDCSNDEVSAVTQTTQRSWEARPTRMLLLQVTDGVQSLEAMEYQFIPELSAELRCGAKLQLQGKIVCRLGVLLLGPSNVKVLGGEVEDLVERNSKGRVLCRTLGIPEEQQQETEAVEPAPPQGNQEEGDSELNDAELLASLEAQEEVEMLQVRPAQDSGYETLRGTSTPSSWSSSVRSFFSTASSRSETSTNSSRSGLMQSRRGASVQEQERSGFSPSDTTHSEIQDHHMADEDFPDEDFDDLPLDELDNMIFQENAPPLSESRPRNTPVTGNVEPGLRSSVSRHTAQKRDRLGCPVRVSGGLNAATSQPSSSPSALNSLQKSEAVVIPESDCMDEDMDCLFEDIEGCDLQTDKSGGSSRPPVQQMAYKDRESAASGSSWRLSSKSRSSGTSSKTGYALESTCGPLQGQIPPSGSFESVRLSSNQQCDSAAPAVTLTSKPFTYLCVLEKMTSSPQPQTTEIHVKAFIVTLLGKLSSSNGVWSVRATISDGTGYLDVELSDEVLTSLLGFSVPEKGALKRDPARRAELDAGMRRCQEELVDMCCVMTITVEPGSGKAVVTKADPVSETALRELEQRARERRR
ncbi:recQ-mediated genome instability protein 1 [Salarias fasciatus]|uniref:recQ-mediated genome instability protein 1 n=1 Tax=Salarias fasciatus TaxID=181472 RepID=UPI001176A7B5|nr:recQ-mediated genome instability protein 1 [Salarias fasciatus]XP_029961552.1 recQ-mediated genome instability protein 1 [Salarias fasciatus]XP_029961553.1 recQ-mediated genome instability protein 1 [Salarias fasciatus]